MPDLKPRSECTCLCHSVGGVHWYPCCKEDPLANTEYTLAPAAEAIDIFPTPALPVGRVEPDVSADGLTLSITGTSHVSDVDAPRVIHEGPEEKTK